MQVRKGGCGKGRGSEWGKDNPKKLDYTDILTVDYQGVQPLAVATKTSYRTWLKDVVYISKMPRSAKRNGSIQDNENMNPCGGNCTNDLVEYPFDKGNDLGDGALYGKNDMDEKICENLDQNSSSSGKWLTKLFSNRKLEVPFLPWDRFLELPGKLFYEFWASRGLFSSSKWPWDFGLNQLERNVHADGVRNWSQSEMGILQSTMARTMFTIHVLIPTG